MVMAVPSTGASTRATVSTSVNCIIPSGIVAGEMVVAYVFAAFPATTTAAAAFTAPTGAGTWFLGPNTTYHDTVNGAFVVMAQYYKYAVGTETAGATYTFGIAAPSEFFAVMWASHITGGPTSGNPYVDTTQTANNGTANATTLSMTGFTPGGAGSLLLAMHFAGSAGGTITQPTGWSFAATFANNGTDGMASAIEYIVQTTAAATGTLAFKESVSTTMGALVGTIRPASGAPSFSDNGISSGSSSLSASGNASTGSSTTTSGTTTLSASGNPAFAGSASMSGTTTLSSTGKPSFASSTSTTQTATLSATGKPAFSASTSTTQTATLTASGKPNFSSAVSTGQTMTLSASGTPSTSAGASTSGLTTLSASGTPSMVGAASLGQVTMLTASATGPATATAVLSGVTTLLASLPTTDFRPSYVYIGTRGHVAVLARGAGLAQGNSAGVPSDRGSGATIKPNRGRIT